MTTAQRTRLFAAACAGIFVFGIVLALLGTMFGLPGVRERYGVDLAAQGDLFLLLFLGIFVTTTVTGPLLDRFGARAVLATSSGLVAAALVGFARAGSFRGAALSAVALGLGGGGLNTANNVLVSDLFDADRAPRLNLLGGFFGIGALVIPLAAASLIHVVALEQMLLASAGLAVASAIGYAALPFPPAREGEGFALRRVFEVVRYPGVLLFAALLFFQSGNEASIGGWTSTYVRERGWPPEVATRMLAGYWAALMLGRLASARLLARASKPAVVAGSGLAAAIGSLLVLVARSTGWMTVGVLVLGGAFASVYPTVLAMAGDRYRRYSGSVFSALFSIALVGGMIFPWTIGHLAQAFGVRSGMILPLVGSLMVAALVTAIARRGEASARGGRWPTP
jgi:fucose permease